MKSKLLNGIASVLFISIFLSTAYAEDVYWNINPDVNSCSMEVDPALTQSQFHTFTKQASLIATFKSLSSAEPLGVGNFSFGLDLAYTPVDQHDSAWINTFTHPDEDCPLGDAVSFPTVRARMGVLDNMDVGAYFTTAPDANYGFLGGEVKYAFLRESERLPAAAVRTSFVSLLGVDDMNMNVYSVDFSVSKRLGMFTPYLGIRETLAIGTETTSKVDLDRENVWTTQGIAGIDCSISRFSIAAEYNVGEVSTFSVATGIRF